MTFLKEFFNAPNVTGAIAPSSPYLARVIVEKAAVSQADRILELGPGTGVFTEAIRQAKKPASRFVALEYNEVFATRLKARFPDVSVVQGCVSRLREHASQHDCAGAGSIVCGLPWTAFEDSAQRTMLGEIRETLGEKGIFATFAYFGLHWLPGGQRFRQLLTREFRRVELSPVVLRNLPPAFVYTCSK